jgi:hypothetical protein
MSLNTGITLDTDLPDLARFTHCDISSIYVSKALDGVVLSSITKYAGGTSPTTTQSHLGLGREVGGVVIPTLAAWGWARMGHPDLLSVALVRRLLVG